jgi:hypothetical protein
MRHVIAVPTVTAVLIASLLAGCGGGGSSSSSSTGAATSTSTNTGASTPVCATFALVESAGNSVEKLDSGNASAAQVKQAAGNLQKSVKALSSAASEAAGQTGSEVKSAVDTFQSQVDAAQGQPASQQLKTLGAAAGKLESSLNQTIAQLGCKQ